MCRPDDRDLGLLPQVRAVRVRWLRGGTGASRRPVLPLHLPRRGLRARLGLVAAGVRQLVRMAPRGDGGGRAGVQQRAPRDLLRRGRRPSRGAVMTRADLAEWCVNVTEKAQTTPEQSAVLERLAGDIAHTYEERGQFRTVDGFYS